MAQSGPLTTRFSHDCGLTYPFACAGLAFAGTTPELAIAVTKAGGIGALGMGKLPPEGGAAMIGAFRQAASGPLNVNFITIFTGDAHIDMCCAEKPEVVSFHWGHPKKAWIDQLHDAGIKVWEQGGSIAMAETALADGIDCLIVQGTEAGGHNYGTLPLFVQLPAMRDAFPEAMLLAAGGIMDGRGVAAALALGADGVWVGTRLIATQEANIAPAYKDKLIAAAGEDTVRSSLFGKDTPDFNPMRLLKTEIVKEYAGRENEAPSDPMTQPVLGEMAIGPQVLPINRFSNLLPMGNATGDVEQMPLLAGQGVGQVKDLPLAGELVLQMMREAADILQSFGGAA
ncbi:MAG: NAD(P)H-dependent flavin oxidoreductase [Sphingomonadales bacterium]